MHLLQDAIDVDTVGLGTILRGNLAIGLLGCGSGGGVLGTGSSWLCKGSLLAFLEYHCAFRRFFVLSVTFYSLLMKRQG